MSYQDRRSIDVSLPDQSSREYTTKYTHYYHCWQPSDTHINKQHKFYRPALLIQAVYQGQVLQSSGLHHQLTLVISDFGMYNLEYCL